MSIFYTLGYIYFGPQLDTTCFVVKDGPKCIAKYSLINLSWFYDNHLKLFGRIILLTTRNYNKIFTHTMLSHQTVRVCAQKIGWLVVQQLLKS